MATVLWGEEPDEHGLPPRLRTISPLIASDAQISEIVAALKKAPIVHKKAKDLLRASRLALLPADNPHVCVDVKKIKKGKPLFAPSWLCAGDLNTDVGDADRRTGTTGLVRELLHRREHRYPGAHRPGDQVATGGLWATP